MPSEVAFPFVCFCRCPFWVPRKGPAPRPWAPGPKPRAARTRHGGWGCLGSGGLGEAAVGVYGLAVV